MKLMPCIRIMRPAGTGTRYIRCWDLTAFILPQISMVPPMSVAILMILPVWIRLLKLIRSFRIKGKKNERIMQNHSPYTDGYQNLQGNVTVDGTVSAQLSEYLTLVKLSDAALEKLIDYFETQDEPTVIVFFGDHQPTDAVVEPIWNLEGKSSSDLTEEENQLRYKVPYVIWANYDIDEAVNQESSANYLGAQMMEAAGIPLSDYQNYLLEQKKEMPLISTQHTEAEGSDAWLNYQTLQYYLLFDWDGEK